MTKVKLLQRSGLSALISWTDESGIVHRGAVPKKEVKKGYVSSDILKMAIPLDGVDLVEKLETDTLTISIKNLQNGLRSAGLFTPQDYLGNPEVISGVLQRLYGLDVATIQNLVAHI
jgi:hypothetical protein